MSALDSSPLPQNRPAASNSAPARGEQALLVEVQGYPAPFKGMGMADHITVGGFTRDGKEFGYCHVAGGRGGTVCTFVNADGKISRTLDFDGPGASEALSKQTADWLKSQGLIEISSKQDAPPMLRGRWPDGVQLVVEATPAGDKALPMVRVGGKLPGEQAVFPLVLKAPRETYKNGTKLEVMPFAFTEVDLLALSPDTSELGVVVHSHCMEYCDPIEVARMPVRRFIARVYNDTAFRHHKSGDYRLAATFFEQATRQDGAEPLYAYNLACSYAKLGDSRTQDALRTAIRLGGPPFAQRAAADPDFGALRTEGWFRAMVAQAK